MMSCPMLVVVLNYRVADLTIDCLDSLAGEIQTLPDARVVVVDNASGDGSAERITAAIQARGWGAWASVLPLTANRGYASGNNAAIRVALAATDPPTCFLLLNPDTRLRPGALGALRGCLAQQPTAGIVGSRLEDPDGTPQRSAFRFPTLAGEMEATARLKIVSMLLARRVMAPPPPASACATDWVAGACMLVRREVFETVGLLDEGYFLYYEDVDLCHRAWQAGWRCWYEPASRVVHLVGQSTGVTATREQPGRQPVYWFQSRQRYWLTYHGRLATACADGAWLLNFAAWRARRALQRNPDRDPPRLLADFWRFSILRKGWRS